ncbi:MAG: hypothetical protein V4625_01740 [Pseudomonadota bacterium]
MFSTPSSRQRPTLWARFAAFLSFLAVMSALVAPASMLAEEVRTGKLGGVCAVNSAFQGSADGAVSADGDAGNTGSHCELCGSLGMALPPLEVASVPCVPGTQVADASLPSHHAGSIPGLPFSRGPPAL